MGGTREGAEEGETFQFKQGMNFGARRAAGESGKHHAEGVCGVVHHQVGDRRRRAPGIGMASGIVGYEAAAGAAGWCGSGIMKDGMRNTNDVPACGLRQVTGGIGEVGHCTTVVSQARMRLTPGHLGLAGWEVNLRCGNPPCRSAGRSPRGTICLRSQGEGLKLWRRRWRPGDG